MAPTHITDPASLDRLSRMLAALELSVDLHYLDAGRCLDADDVPEAERHMLLARYGTDAAVHVRARLLAARAESESTDLTEALARLPDEKLAAVAPPAAQSEESDLFRLLLLQLARRLRQMRARIDRCGDGTP